MTAVLTQSPTDVLSHVAIRARSQGVLLATCFDEAALGSIKQMEGKNVRLNVDATGAVVATESAAPSASNGATPKSGEQQSTTAAFGQGAVCERRISFVLQSMFILWHHSSLMSSVSKRICALKPPALAEIALLVALNTLNKGNSLQCVVFNKLKICNPQVAFSLDPLEHGIPFKSW